MYIVATGNTDSPKDKSILADDIQEMMEQIIVDQFRDNFRFVKEDLNFIDSVGEHTRNASKNVNEWDFINFLSRIYEELCHKSGIIITFENETIELVYTDPKFTGTTSLKELHEANMAIMTIVHSKLKKEFGPLCFINDTTVSTSEDIWYNFDTMSPKSDKSGFDQTKKVFPYINPSLIPQDV
jgi:hypothetical protein